MMEGGIDPLLDDVARAIEREAQSAFARLLQLLAEGMAAADAVRTVANTFNGAYRQQLQERFSQIMGRAVTEGEVSSLPVSGVPLSSRLYRFVQQTSQEVAAIVRTHAAGFHDARALAMRLYDGYDPKDGIVRPLEGRAMATLPKPLLELVRSDVRFKDGLGNLLEQVQQAAARLKTQALRAAYSETVDAWLNGASKQVLERRLEVAYKEKTRYFANRIAQTELARSYQLEQAQGFMADAQLTVLQVQLSPAHVRLDICDLHANADLFKLGPGCYPKELAPVPPWHPHCRCVLRSRPSLHAKNAKPVEDGEGAYLRSLSPWQAAQVMGSRDRLERVLSGGESVEDVVNAGKDAEYHLKRAGAVVNGAKSSKLPLPDLQNAMKQYENSTPNRISPVSNALSVPESAQYDQVRSALAAIDSVHDDGRLPKTKVKLNDFLPEIGDYIPSLNRLSLQPGTNQIDTVFHEVAHMLDLHAFGHGQMYETSNPAGRLNRVVSAALKSNAAEEWRSVKVDGAMEYLLDPAEIWARAYTQWIATKTSTYVNFNAEIGYWTNSDFVAIVKEIEDAFRLEGWL